MLAMYCGVAKTPGIPLFSAVSRTRCSKQRSFSDGSSQIIAEVVRSRSCTVRPHCIRRARFSLGGKALKGSIGYDLFAMSKIFLGGRPLGSTYRVSSRGLSVASCERTQGSGDGGSAGKKLPWIAAFEGRRVKVSDQKVKEKPGTLSSWEESANKFLSKKSRNVVTDNKRDRAGTAGDSENKRISSFKAADAEREEKAEEDEDEDADASDDERWNRIKTRHDTFVDRDARFERPEVAQWKKQETWGKKTWKEATESKVPKMVGEAVYGVGPVLAALTVGRRDFYALYVQEGLDFKKKKKMKDKKGVENILKMAEKIGLTVKVASKHDLNMVVDNRPHQGLVLDATPLEMINIKELDPVSVGEGEKAPVWVALDEVTDPQNLGAILRSSYFFGVKGVVVCAKNSAPLSGVVSKASAGSLELVELRSCKNMMQFLTSSVENGWRVLGGSVSCKALPLNEVQTGCPTILVLGSEGTGLRPLVERSCTHLVKIPGGIPLGVRSDIGEGEEALESEMSCVGEDYRSFFAVESLNVSVATGVLLYHLVGNNNCDGAKNCVTLTME